MDAQWETLVALPSKIISDDETWTPPPVRNCNNPPTTADFRLNGQSMTTSEGERDSELDDTKRAEDEMAQLLMADQRPEQMRFAAYFSCGAEMDAQSETLVAFPSQIITDDENLPWTLPPVRNRDSPPTPADFHLNGPSITTSEGERETANSTPNKDAAKITRREVSTETTRDV